MGYKLVCFDMDGVIFKDTNFWLRLHDTFGTLKRGKELTKKYLYSDCQKLNEEVIGELWKGKDANPYYNLVDSLEYLPGVRETFEYLKKKGYLTAIVSASSIDAARRVQRDFGVDFIFANEMIVRDGKISGEFVWPVGGGKDIKKVKIVRDLCSALGINAKECIYVGDNYEDIGAFKEVGMSIAFNSSSDELKEVATYVVDTNKLSDVVRYL
ncbi:MAG: HAD family phosphatase [archaeon]